MNGASVATAPTGPPPDDPFAELIRKYNPPTAQQPTAPAPDPFADLIQRYNQPSWGERVGKRVLDLIAPAGTPPAAEAAAAAEPAATAAPTPPPPRAAPSGLPRLEPAPLGTPRPGPELRAATPVPAVRPDVLPGGEAYVVPQVPPTDLATRVANMIGGMGTHPVATAETGVAPPFTLRDYLTQKALGTFAPPEIRAVLERTLPNPSAVEAASAAAQLAVLPVAGAIGREVTATFAPEAIAAGTTPPLAARMAGHAASGAVAGPAFAPHDPLAGALTGGILGAAGAAAERGEAPPGEAPPTPALPVEPPHIAELRAIVADPGIPEGTKEAATKLLQVYAERTATEPLAAAAPPEAPAAAAPPVRPPAAPPDPFGELIEKAHQEAPPEAAPAEAPPVAPPAEARVEAPPAPPTAPPAEPSAGGGLKTQLTEPIAPEEAARRREELRGQPTPPIPGAEDLRQTDVFGKPPEAPPAEGPPPEARPTEAPPEEAPPAPPEKALPASQVVDEDGVKRFRDLRSPSGKIRPDITKVANDGLVSELNSLMDRMSDASRRSLYELREDADMHTMSEIGARVIAATRKGGGPSMQAKAFRNLEQMGKLSDRITAELKRRGLDDNDIADRVFGHVERTEEREGMQGEGEFAHAGPRDVIRDEHGNVLFTPAAAGTAAGTAPGTAFDPDAPPAALAPAPTPGQHAVAAAPAGAPATTATAAPTLADVHTTRRISERLADAVGVPTRKGYFPFSRAKAKGAYKIHPEVSRVIDLAHLDAVAHETGHHVAHTELGGITTGRGARGPTIPAGYGNAAAELETLGKDLYGPTKPAAGYAQEGVAELFKYYVIDQDHLKQRAPDALRWLEQDVFPRVPEIANAFKEAHNDFVNYQQAPGAAKIRATYRQVGTVQSMGEAFADFFRKLNLTVNDDLEPFQEIEKQAGVPPHMQDSPYETAMTTRAVGNRVKNGLLYGIRDALGNRISPSLKAELLDKIPEGRLGELNDYLFAERLNEQASHEVSYTDKQGNVRRASDILTEAPHLIAQHEAAMTKRIGELTPSMEETNRATGKTIRAGLTFDENRQVVERGRADPVMSKLAKVYWDFNNATRRLKVNHLTTPTEDVAMAAANQKHVDFHRYFEPDEVLPRSGGVGRIGTNISEKRLRESSRLFRQSPIESLIANYWHTEKLVHQQLAFEAVVKHLTGPDAPPGMGGLLEKVSAPHELTRIFLDEDQIKDLANKAGIPAHQFDAFKTALDGHAVERYTAQQYATGRNARDMTLPYLVNGERQWFKFGDKQLLNGLMGLNHEELPAWQMLPVMVARTMRALTTLVPGFVFGRHALRDAIEASIYSKGGFRAPFHALARGLQSMMAKDEYYHLFEAEGGDNIPTQALYDRQHVQDYIRDLSKNPALKELNRETTVVTGPARFRQFRDMLTKEGIDRYVVRPLEKTAAVITRAPRIGETRFVHERLTQELEAKAAAQNRAPTPEERIDVNRRAAAAGREVTLNLTRGGSQLKSVNRLSPFFRAEYEAMRRFVGSVKEKPGRTLGRLSAVATIPAMATYFAQRKDPYYGNTPSYMKNTGLVFIQHNDDGTLKRRWWIPFPAWEYWLGAVVPTRLAEYLDTKNPNALRQVWQAFAGNIPNPASGVTPFFETLAGKEFRTGRPIESRAVQELPVEERANPSQGPFMRAAGKVTGKVGLSPAKAEYLAGHYLGGFGKGALAAGDVLTRAIQGPRPGEAVNTPADLDKLSQLPIVGRFARGVGTAEGGEVLQQFFDTYEDYRQRHASFLAKSLAGDPAAQQYLEDNAQAINAVRPKEQGENEGGPMLEAHTAIATLQKVQNLLRTADLTPEQYREQYAQIDQQILSIARHALVQSGAVPPTAFPEQQP